MVTPLVVLANGGIKVSIRASRALLISEHEAGVGAARRFCTAASSPRRRTTTPDGR